MTAIEPRRAPTPIYPLGIAAEDGVSGWAGKITAAYVYMNGCVRYEISGLDKDGAPVGYVFDEGQVFIEPEVLAAFERDENPVTVPAAVESVPPERPRGGPRSSTPVAR